LDNLSILVYEELIKKDHWDRAYDRLAFKDKTDNFDMDDLYRIKETDERLLLAEQICTGTYVWSVPEKLLLAKNGSTKKRTVYMYSGKDRFIIGALYRALGILNSENIADNCFSYKRGVNTSSAIKYISAIKKDSTLFGVKLDISAYFNSVNREHLNNCLTELFGETSGIRKSMDSIFNNDIVMYKGQELLEYKSLVPGCALGSFFANYCLRELDYHFKDKGIVYARYSDDIIVFAETEALVNEHLDVIKERIFAYGLTINESKYVHFLPEQDVEYLGLKLGAEGIDISNHAKNKLKATIRRWVKAGRKSIEIDGKNFDRVAKNMVNRLNWKLYKSYVQDERKFGWAYYAFRYITDLQSLTELDFYLRDRLRYLKTGRNNKANVKALNDEDFRNLGVLSLYDMYLLFHEDFDYYCEVAYLV
jgi:RNA-directed DNA polymerase